MNTKIIIYDDSCPLCTAYTTAFVQTGLIEKEGRKSFSTVQPEWIAMVDIKKAVNEIPVIDSKTKQVWYGIDALLEILGQKIPIVKITGNVKPVKWLLKKFYNLISYNRRVIVANRNSRQGFDCTPDFNIPYRILFIMLLSVFNSWMLMFPLQQFVLSDSLFINTSIQQLAWIISSIALIQLIIAVTFGERAGIEYLGQVNMLALTSVLLTIPLISINKYFNLHNHFINNTYLAMLIFVVSIEFMRRMKFVGIIPAYPSVAFLNGIWAGILLGYETFN